MVWGLQPEHGACGSGPCPHAVHLMIEQPHDVKPGGGTQGSFLAELADTNLTRMWWLLLTSTTLSVAMAVLNFLQLRQAEFVPWHVFDIGGSLIFLALIWLGREKKLSLYWRWKLSPAYFGFWLILMDGYYFNALPTLGETATYALGVVTPAVLILLPPRLFLGMLIPNHLIYCVLLLVMEGTDNGLGEKAFFAALANGSLGVLIATLAAWFLYASRLKEYKKSTLVSRRTQEARLAASNLIAILENIPFRAWLKDPDDHFLAVNREFARAWERKAEEIIGKTSQDIYPEDFSKQQRAEDKDVIRGGVKRYFEQARIEHGDKRWFEIFKSPVFDESRHCIGVVGLSRDITERKEMEKKLLAADTAKTEFLATVSHEIRTPMNSVLGYAQLLREMPMNPMQREYVESINCSGQLLLTVINDILDFSKIETGKVVIQHTPVRLHDLFTRVMGMFQPMAREKVLELRLNLDSSVPEVVLADAHRIEQMLVNLLSNALKFTNIGSVTLDVSASKHSGRKGSPTWHLSMRVIDTGIGIAPDQTDRLFKPFSQIDSAISRKYGGTGLGLVIAQRLCRMMHGKIEVESELDKGSAFTAVIEVGVHEEQREMVFKPRKEVSDDDIDISSTRVLIVEDNAINRRLVSTILARWAVKASAASGGMEALRMLERNEYDIILMDVQMPGMDGFETTRRIREWESAEPGRQRHHIIALTAFAMADDSARCLSAGMDDYLAKPVNPLTLKKAIAKGLDLQSGLPRESDV